MADPTERRERTLPPAATAAGSDEEDSTTTTIVEFTPVSLSAVRDDDPRDTGEVTVEDAEPANEQAASPASPAGDVLLQSRREAGNRGAAVLRTSLKAVAWMAVFPVLCILPFIVVLRISVVSYQESMYDGWESLGIGMIAAVLLVCLYIAAFMWSFGIRRRLFMPILNVCLTAMLVYCGYALFHLANSNAKTEEVRSYYTSLHPFLRVAVKNLTFLDKELVITDMHRTKEDYEQMGLRPREYSLHFKQPTGFVHAVDLRTNGRPQVTNLLVELYFILMGFETIRHVGTADHIHVSLPLSEEDLAASPVAGNGS